MELARMSKILPCISTGATSTRSVSIMGVDVYPGALHSPGYHAGRTIRRSVAAGAVDHFFECAIFTALGPANQTHLLKVVLGFEQVALFGLPHAVIGPGQGVLGIGGERLLVPIFGVVVAAELAAG